MTSEKLKSIIIECCNDVSFDFNGKPCGVTSTVDDSRPTFQIWYGDKTKEFGNVEDLMNDDFFDGKSLNNLCEKLDIYFF